MSFARMVNLQVFGFCSIFVFSNGNPFREAQDSFAQGQRLHKDGNLEGAKAFYEQAAALQPSWGMGIFGLGLIADETGNHSQALRLYQQAHSLDPTTQAGHRAQELVKLVAMEPVQLDADEQRKALELLRSGVVPEGQHACGAPRYLWAWRGVLANETLEALQESWPAYLKHLEFNDKMQVTFWHPKEKFKKPRTAVELAIWRMRPLVPISDEELVGVEWWPRRHIVKKGMNLHVDQDMATDRRLQRFPAFSSVLYLSDGGPTCVLKQTVDTSGQRVPPVPPNSTIAYPQRGFFVVFSGELIHGVLPPVEPSTAVRDVLVMNWWRRRPSPPTCNGLPKAIRKENRLSNETLLKLVGLSKNIDPEQVTPTCAWEEAGARTMLFTNFGNMHMRFPVPSDHTPGEVTVIDWTSLVAERSEL